MQSAAKKPSVFHGKGNIYDWIESMKAYFACSNPSNTTEEVIIAQVKTYIQAAQYYAEEHELDTNYAKSCKTS